MELFERLGEERLRRRTARLGCGASERQQGQHEALLRAVVQIALELPAGLIGRRGRGDARGGIRLARVGRFARLRDRGAIAIPVVGGRIAARQEQLVALRVRDPELVGEACDHPCARTRAAGLDEAEMSCRDARLQRELKLAELSPLAPRAQQDTDTSALPRVIRRRRRFGCWS
jgi:hypothetical protein